MVAGHSEGDGLLGATEPVARGREGGPQVGRLPYSRSSFERVAHAVGTLYDAEGEALHTIRYGRMPNGDATALCEGMLADVAALLHQRPDLKVQTLVDGAAEMHNLLAAAVNQATLGKPVYELVDFGHLLQKLTPAAAVIFGEAASQVRARWKLSLLNTRGAVWKILAEPFPGCCSSPRRLSCSSG
jgi:hypothetical protein